jgi:DNA-binding response OmpR family regulator/anti-sigma regulatory factor (Ser/Thr protein kinase)
MDYDPDNLQKIVSNLLSNAIKFTDKGEILLSVYEEPLNGQNCVKVVVKDTGIGISKGNLPFIFDRFYQVEDAEKKTIKGSGIGMALVKELVHLMGGNIEIESEPRIGTSVTFFLPVTNKAKALEQPSLKLNSILDEPFDLPKAWEFSEESEGNPIVLLIEDNTDVLYYLNTCLQDNYRLVQARDGNEGIKKALDFVPDIIISDVMMPGKTGFEVCETLKEDTRTSHIPIVLLTAKAEIQDKISGIKHGADAYLIKPFIVDELLVQVENLIRTREILNEKFRNSQFDDIHRADYPVKENEFLIRLNNLIKEELSNPELNVEKVCEQLYMSRTQLHRKIKALTNKSITAYIRSYRLHEALNMIIKTNLTIQQIAYETGFSDASYFHRSFVKEFNKKPTDFRSK